MSVGVSLVIRVHVRSTSFSSIAESGIYRPFYQYGKYIFFYQVKVIFFTNFVSEDILVSYDTDNPQSLLFYEKQIIGKNYITLR